eukprot:5502583-Alexandrium_andersonii.AAC.1
MNRVGGLRTGGASAPRNTARGLQDREVHRSLASNQFREQPVHGRSCLERTCGLKELARVGN